MSSGLVLAIASLCLLAIYVDALHPRDCSDRQNFVVDDMGCHPSCSMPYIPNNFPCGHGPYPACVCKPEYLEADDGECVRYTWCPRRDCPPNEHFEPSTIACEPSCDNPAIRPGFLCSHDPIAMCVCNKGFYRSEDYSCVKLSDCFSASAKSLSSSLI